MRDWLAEGGINALETIEKEEPMEMAGVKTQEIKKVHMKRMR